MAVNETVLADTPEDAATMLDMLTSDRDFGARYFNGDKAAAAQVDYLVEKKQGAAPPAPEPVAAPDPHARTMTIERMTPHERQIHQDIFEPPEDPSRYTIQHGRELSDDERTLDGTIRGWMKDGGLPVSDGNFLAEVALKVGPQLAAMNVGERETYRMKTEQKLRNFWRDDTPTRLADAQRLVNEVEAGRPGIKAWLEASGLGDSFEVIAQIGEIAKRRYAK
jgi:hypothetical protein